MARREKTASVQLKVRMREPLRRRLEQYARVKGISLNAEIVQRLERSVEHPDLIDEVVRFFFGEGHDHFVVALRKQVVTLPGLIRATGVEPIEMLKELPDYWDAERKAKEKSYEKARDVALRKAIPPKGHR